MDYVLFLLVYLAHALSLRELGVNTVHRTPQHRLYPHHILFYNPNQVVILLQF